MKAVAVVLAERAVKVVDHPETALRADTDVHVRILDVGVCGTDREVARFEYGAPPQDSPYLVIGHESLGEVIEVGAKVVGLRPGDLVVTMVRRPCGHPDCPACAAGRPDFCLTGQFTERGINGRHGFMTERIVDDYRYMIALASSLRDVGVLLEPLTIAEKALIEAGDVEDRLPWLKAGAPHGAQVAPPQRALVLGAGPVGLLGALALLLRGYRTWVYSREPADSVAAQWVKSVGGEYLCGDQIPIDEVPAIAGNIDLIYEATGASNIAFRALEILGVNGIFVLTGVPGRKAPIEIDADLIMRNLVLKNQLVYGTVNAGRDAFEAAARDLAEFQRRWPTQLAALITGRYPPEACREVLLGKREGIKQVIAFADRQ